MGGGPGNIVIIFMPESQSFKCLWLIFFMNKRHRSYIIKYFVIRISIIRVTPARDDNMTRLVDLTDGWFSGVQGTSISW